MEDRVWTIYLCFWLAVFGAVLGSFLDCAASRWAAGAPPFRGRSRCSSCGHALGAGDLIPVFSFLRRRGRCRYCGERIPADCLAAELAGAAALACMGPLMLLDSFRATTIDAMIETTIISILMKILEYVSAR